MVDEETKEASKSCTTNTMYAGLHGTSCNRGPSSKLGLLITCHQPVAGIQNRYAGAHLFSVTDYRQAWFIRQLTRLSQQLSPPSG